jgi:hypothetical protein
LTAPHGRTSSSTRTRPIFNKHDHYQADLVDADQVGIEGRMMDLRQRQAVGDHRLAEFLVAIGDARERAQAWAVHPKKDGTPRSIGFRKAVSRQALSKWKNAWHLLGEAPLADDNMPAA